MRNSQSSISLARQGTQVVVTAFNARLGEVLKPHLDETKVAIAEEDLLGTTQELVLEVLDIVFDTLGHLVGILIEEDWAVMGQTGDSLTLREI